MLILCTQTQPQYMRAFDIACRCSPQALLAGLGYDLNYAELLQAVQPAARPWLLGNLLAASLQEPERQSMVTWHLLRLVAEPAHLPPQVGCS
jgi:hypothetical protein